ncbi:MAG: type II toxin-antitoxin system Phd/YefM family antitoxin [Actinomycetota bacterium]
MLSVGIKTLKNKLSEYVRLAAAGETVLISDRDRVVAELVPVSANRQVDVQDAVLADAVRNGYITPAVLPPGPPPESPAIGTLKQVLASLQADREDR